MDILIVTNEFPNALDPTKAVFNLSLARALAQQHRVRVVSPVPWLDEWRAGSLGRRTLAKEADGGRSRDTGLDI